MMDSTAKSGSEGLALTAGLERAVYSGRLAAELVDRRTWSGGGDLLLSVIEVGRERFFTPPERIREIGRRTGERVTGRLAERLRSEWGVAEVAALPWAVFKTLAGQLSEALGFGALEFTVEESSGLIRVRAWQWPLPDELAADQLVYTLIEGFVTSVLESVSPRPLEAVEVSQPGADGVCEFVVGSQEAVRAYLAASGRRGSGGDES